MNMEYTGTLQALVERALADTNGYWECHDCGRKFHIAQLLLHCPICKSSNIDTVHAEDAQ